MLLSHLKKSWLNAFSAFLLVSGLILWVVVPTSAQGETEETPDDTNTEDSSDDAEPKKCISDIAQGVAELDTDAIEYYDQHYKSEDPASDLSVTAWEKFKEYSENTWSLFFNFKDNSIGRLTAKEYEELDACMNYVEEHIDTIEQTMTNQNYMNANSKKTYTLVRKLQDINDGLRDLNVEFGHMYGAFKTFHDKFPGYIPKPIK